MKEKKFYDEFIGENDSAILFNKLKIHEELKNRVIDDKNKTIHKLLAKIAVFEKGKENPPKTVSVYTKPANYFNQKMMNSKNKKQTIKSRIMNTLSVSADLITDHEKKGKDDYSNPSPSKTPTIKPSNLSKSQINMGKFVDTKKTPKTTSVDKIKTDIKPEIKPKKIQIPNRNEKLVNKSNDYDEKYYSEIMNNRTVNLSTISNTFNKTISSTKSNNLNNTSDMSRNKKPFQTMNTKDSQSKANAFNEQDKKKILESIEKDFYEHFYKGKAKLTPLLQKLKNK